MIFPHQIAFLYQWFITLPAVCLLSIAMNVNKEYRRGFPLNQDEIKADIVIGAFVWLPCWGLLKLIVWRWGDGWFNISVFYLFYGSLLMVMVKALRKAVRYHNAVEEFVYWCKNLVRPSWDKIPCPFKGRGMAGIGREYAEDNTRREKVFKQNQTAVDRVDNDRILFKIATQAADYGIREYALIKMKDRALVKQALTKMEYSNSLLFRLVGAETLEEAIERAGDVQLLLQMIRHCREEKDIEKAFAKLPEDFDFSTIVCEVRYADNIRLKALEKCNDAETVRRIILKLTASERSSMDELRIKAAEKCNDPELIQTILPQLFHDFGGKDLSRIIRKCGDNAILKKIAGNALYCADINRIEAIQSIAEQEFLVELALKTNKRNVAEAALKKVDQTAIEEHWRLILEQLEFELLSPLLDKMNCCPNCGGQISIHSSSSTRTVGAPGDSFYRTTEWYEDTSTFSSMQCNGCKKVWRTHSY